MFRKFSKNELVKELARVENQIRITQERLQFLAKEKKEIEAALATRELR